MRGIYVIYILLHYLIVLGIEVLWILLIKQKKKKWLVENVHSFITAVVQRHTAPASLYHPNETPQFPQQEFPERILVQVTTNKSEVRFKQKWILKKTLTFLLWAGKQWQFIQE